jgi:hypothetical protein
MEHPDAAIICFEMARRRFSREDRQTPAVETVPHRGDMAVSPAGKGELASLDDRQLKDVGISREAVLREARKPFWRA